jgi:hypothetical protein
VVVKGDPRPDRRQSWESLTSVVDLSVIRAGLPALLQLEAPR